MKILLVLMANLQKVTIETRMPCYRRTNICGFLGLSKGSGNPEEVQTGPLRFFGTIFVFQKD